MTDDHERAPGVSPAARRKAAEVIREFERLIKLYPPREYLPYVAAKLNIPGVVQKSLPMSPSGKLCKGIQVATMYYQLHVTQWLEIEHPAAATRLWDGFFERMHYALCRRPVTSRKNGVSKANHFGNPTRLAAHTFVARVLSKRPDILPRDRLRAVVAEWADDIATFGPVPSDRHLRRVLLKLGHL